MIGIHLNKKSKDFLSNFEYAQNRGINVVQIFTTSPKRFDFPLKRLDPEDANKTKQLIQKNNTKLFIHSSYLLNFCDTDKNPRNAKLYSEDLQICEKLGGIGCVIHMGKKKPHQTVEEAMDAYAENIKVVLDKYKGDSYVILETAAGQGNDIGVQNEQLAQIYDKFAGYKRRVRFCIDTCHIFAAGYDITDKYFELFDKLIGMDKVVLFHLNDSKVPLGAKKDRHEDLQEGYVFKDNINKLQLIVDMSKKYNIPMVLETPSRSDKQIALVRSLDNDKAKIIGLLRELADLYAVLHDTRRRNSFMKAVSYLNEQDIIPDEKHELVKIKGVGPNIADKIIEIKKTGRLSKLDKLALAQKNDLRLLKVKGVGPAHLKKFKDIGIETLEDLKQSDINLTKLQQLGLKYYDDLNSRIPRDEIATFDKKFQKILKKLQIKGEITGSYRRGAETSHDIDIVITGEQQALKQVVTDLKNSIKFIADLSSGTKRYSGLFVLDKIVRQIDILYTHPESYLFALIHFTGPQEKNIIMRNKAKEMGYKLNELGMIKGNTSVKIKTEDELMKILDL